MNKLIIATVLALVAAMPAHSRNNSVNVTLESVLSMPEAQAKLDGSVKFYLAGAKTPKNRKLGDDVANAKTNAFNKSPEEACRWNVLTALIKFEEHAKRQGANAVVDLVSYNDRVPVSNPTELQCRDGALIGGVTLKGSYAKIGK
ncbi:MAG: excinuclease ATPase subunit [Burkholderiaceae bacterium]|jgi:hypothetical protein